MFGLGNGSVEVKLEKNSFAYSETIKGLFVINLNKPVKANKVFVRLMATRKTHTSKGKDTNITLYHFMLDLDGEKEYSVGKHEYSFELKLPEKTAVEPSVELGGIAGTIVDILAASRIRSAIKWWLMCGLDVPMSLDVSKTIQLNIA